MVEIEESHKITSFFPAEEKNLPVGLMRRSSRSVAVNLADTWKQWRYEEVVLNRLIDRAKEGEALLTLANEHGRFKDTGFVELIGYST